MAITTYAERFSDSEIALLRQQLKAGIASARAIRKERGHKINPRILKAELVRAGA